MATIFSIMHVLLNGQFRDDPTSLKHKRMGGGGGGGQFPIYLNKPSIALVS